MDADTTSLSNTHNNNDAIISTMLPADSSANVSSSSSAALAWDTTDATSLAPSNVPIAKVQRAWERKPQSPFSRRRFKVGKIFKRNQLTAAGPSAFAAPFNVHIRAPTSNESGTPLKVVKKLRVVSDAPSGFGAVVSNWEGRGSPTNRRIVTRASLNRGDGEELIALADEDDAEREVSVDGDEAAEDDQVVEGTTIEILNEDGTITGDANASLDADEWEYESATEADDEEEIERQVALARQRSQEENEQARIEACGMAIAGMGTPVYYGPRREGRTSVSPPAAAPPPVMSVDEHNWTSPSSRSRSREQGGIDDNSHKVMTHPSRISEKGQTYKAAMPPPALPEGFVSPAIVRRRPINQVRQKVGNRRKTLPKDFAATGKNDDSTQEPIPVQEQQPSPELAPEQGFTPEEEEDIRRGLTREDFVPRQQTPEAETQSAPSTTIAESTEPAQQAFSIVQEQDLLPGKLPGSPIPSIAGSHPRLPLRRSPRRQSTSPIKRRSILKASGKSHLIAFTPVKLPVQPGQEDKANLPSSPLPTSFIGLSAVEDTVMEPVTRSSSAPPESPQMSPRKPWQPRISDDTALLEAFLKRASDRRSGKRLSDTERRASLERRRESDVVPQALASSPLDKPATPKTDVLAEMDPNSPSPRKQLAGFSFAPALPPPQIERKQSPVQDDEDELAAETGHPKKFASRKSGRNKRRPDSASQSGPKQITITGSTEGVKLKKTEAQELALETRKNTRDNKQGAVLPLQRLKALAVEQESLPEIIETEHPPERRGITWSETLVSYSTASDEPEVSMTADELGAEPDTEASVAKDEGDAITVAPPASDTPSKPRQRRLKTLRQTASNSGKSAINDASIAQADVSTVSTEGAESKPKPKATARRKIPRIATPGKALKTSSVLDQTNMAEAEPEPEPKKAATAGTSKKTLTAPTTKKIPVPCKLPAPASTAVTGLSAGKENSLIASPPKKRTTKTSAVAAAGPTKGLSSVPKFDLGKATSKTTVKKEDSPPGLMSPAKKAPKLMPPVTRNAADREGANLAPGLGSPAKKRTRRMIG